MKQVIKNLLKSQNIFSHNYIMNKLTSIGKFEVKKGEQFFCEDGEFHTISENKTITRKDFGIPFENNFLAIPKFVLIPANY